jgi:hypothetical protein
MHRVTGDAKCFRFDHEKLNSQLTER